MHQKMSTSTLSLNPKKKACQRSKLVYMSSNSSRQGGGGTSEDIINNMDPRADIDNASIRSMSAHNLSHHGSVIRRPEHPMVISKGLHLIVPRRNRSESLNSRASPLVLLPCFKYRLIFLKYV